MAPTSSTVGERPATKRNRYITSCRPALTAVFALLSAYTHAADDLIPIETFAQLELISSARLSPDGSHFAYLRPIEGRRYIVVQALHSAGKPYVLAPFDNLEYSWLQWANSERIVFAMSFSSKRGITETTETRLLSMRYDATDIAHIIKPGFRDRVGTRIASVQLPAPQIQDDVIDWLPEEPNFILVSVDEDSNGQDEVRKVDIRNGDYDVIRRDTRGIQHWVTDQNHDVRIGYGYDPIRGFVMMYRPIDGDWGQAKDEGCWTSGLMPQAFSADASNVYVMGPNPSGRQSVGMLSIASGDIVETTYTHDSIDATGLVFDPFTNRALGVSYTDDYPRVEYFDEEFKSLQATIDRALPDTINRITSYSDDKRRILIRSFSDVVPGSFYFWDRDEGQMQHVADAMRNLPPEKLASVESHWIDIGDGMRMQMFLTRPTANIDGPVPAVVLPHGGPEARDDRRFWFLSQFLASRGYAVLQPNFRGSTGYGYEYRQAGRQQWGGAMQDDVTTATHWLIDEGIADPERIAIVGWSYGGYAAAMGLIQAPELYRCAVSINGVLNLPRLIADDRQYIGGSVWTKHVGLTEAKSADVSPYHQAERIQEPILVIQAKDDARVHEDQGRNFSKRMKKLKKPIEYVAVDFGGHSMTNEAARLTILKEVEVFLAENMQP